MEKKKLKNYLHSYELTYYDGRRLIKYILSPCQSPPYFYDPLVSIKTYTGYHLREV